MTAKERKPIEQVIAETPYDPAAFKFVQEGVGYAVQQIHGPRSDDEALVDQWMAKTETTYQRLAELYFADELPTEVQKWVERAGGPEHFNRHVSGQELSWVLRDLAIRKWGLMARTVLQRWGVTKSADFGRIVFALVNNDYLQAQPTDSIDDFNEIYDFQEAFSPLACQQIPSD